MLNRFFVADVQGVNVSEKPLVTRFLSGDFLHFGAELTVAPCDGDIHGGRISLCLLERVEEVSLVEVFLDVFESIRYRGPDLDFFLESKDALGADPMLLVQMMVNGTRETYEEGTITFMADGFRFVYRRAKP